MIYAYYTDDGECMEIDCPPDRAPTSPIRHMGKTWYRDWSGVTVNAAHKPTERDGHFESYQAPRWDKNHKGEYGPDGKPRFTSRSQYREYCARVTGETGVDTRAGEL